MKVLFADFGVAVEDDRPQGLVTIITMRPRRKSEAFGGDDYRQGALERIQEAWTLLRAEQFGGCIYIAGRGVEGMLRAVVWKSDLEIQQKKKPLETAHDLRELLTLVRNLGLLRAGSRDSQLETDVQRVARLWFNNMRFASSKFVARQWWRRGEIHSRRTMKQASIEFFDSCSGIIKRCEALYGGTK